jgi:hypothetical protein
MSAGGKFTIRAIKGSQIGIEETSTGYAEFIFT